MSEKANPSQREHRSNTKRSRILFDCSNVNFNSQPSGIPRVVKNYLQEGYAWAEANGVELVPVMPRAHGVIRIHPAPLKVTPEPQRLSLDSAIKPVAHLSYVVAHTVRHLLRRGLHAASSTPGKRPHALLYRIDALLSEWATKIVGLAHKLRPGQELVEIEPGDVLFSAGYWHDNDLDNYRRIKALGCDLVFLLHDVLPVTMPDYYPYPWRKQFSENLLQIASMASLIICVSRSTKKDFLEVATVSCEVLVAHNGYEELGDAETQRPDLTAALTAKLAPFLMVGSVEPKKDHERIIRAFEKKWREGYARGLVIVGVPGWMSADIVGHIRGSEYYGKNLHWFYDLADADVGFAYRRCHALVFASLGEGFGLPLIEAAMAGKPLIVHRTAVAEEIMGSYARYFGPNDEDLDQAIEELERKDNYDARSARMSSFHWPTWSQTASLVFDLVSRAQQ